MRPEHSAWRVVSAQQIASSQWPLVAEQRLGYGSGKRNATLSAAASIWNSAGAHSALLSWAIGGLSSPRGGEAGPSDSR